MIRIPYDPTLRVAIWTAAACSVAPVLYAVTGAAPGREIFAIISYAPLFAVVLWLHDDAQRTGIAPCLDWGMFLWYGWLFLIPWYAFKSRGRRGGWRLLAGLMLLIHAGQLVALVSALLVQHPHMLGWYFDAAP